MIVLYGIPNCDTVRKARAWLDANGVEHTFHNLKTEGVSGERLDAWMRQVGWQKLVNRSGNTWRKLPPALQSAVSDAASARALMQGQTSIIKRPVIEGARELIVGFDEANYRALLTGR
jgi:arsenate reductase (glutaredoxin)